MNLTLVASGDFAMRALNLIGSYFHYSVGEKVIFCYWGIANNLLSAISKHYGKRVILTEVPLVCPHARNPRFYFYKTFAVYSAMQLREPFLYLDAAEEIAESLKDLESLLAERTRVFVQYPRVDFYRNENWTTKACLTSMGMNSQRYLDCHQYMGGFQAYLPTQDNINHVNEMYQFMQKPDIAGPSNWSWWPEGQPGCKQHRNDQSVLSTLIEHRGWHQPFEPTHFMRYGDYPTIQCHTPWVLENPKDYQQSILPRQSSMRFAPGFAKN